MKAEGCDELTISSCEIGQRVVALFLLHDFLKKRRELIKFTGSWNRCFEMSGKSPYLHHGDVILERRDPEALDDHVGQVIGIEHQMLLAVFEKLIVVSLLVLHHMTNCRRNSINIRIKATVMYINIIIGLTEVSFVTHLIGDAEIDNMLVVFLVRVANQLIENGRGNIQHWIGGGEVRGNYLFDIRW